MTYKLTIETSVLFESEDAHALAYHLIEEFPPFGAFPSPNLTTGFAVVLPDGSRLQGLQARRWVEKNR